MLSTLVNHTLPMDSGQRRAILLAVASRTRLWELFLFVGHINVGISHYLRTSSSSLSSGPEDRWGKLLV